MIQPLLLVTRPAEEADQLARAAQAAGFQTLVAPLMRIEAMPEAHPSGHFDALLFTSPQGPRHSLHLKARYGGLPAYAVGSATARAVVDSGFKLAASGDRDGSLIVSRAAMDGCCSVLHLSGEDAAMIEVPPGLQLMRIAVYRAVLVEVLPEPARLALAVGKIFATLLYSARTAERFASLARKAGLERAELALLCLSPAVARAAGQGWRLVEIAEAPSTDALLAAARTLWQSRFDG